MGSRNQVPHHVSFSVRAHLLSNTSPQSSQSRLIALATHTYLFYRYRYSCDIGRCQKVSSHLKSSSTPKDSSMPSIEAIDLIYSCNICHHTLNEIYNNDENENGLKSGHQEDDQITRTWLASCGHFFCGRHLNGGGSNSFSMVCSSCSYAQEFPSTLTMRGRPQYALCARKIQMTMRPRPSTAYEVSTERATIQRCQMPSSWSRRNHWIETVRIWMR